jgi:general secretion pathway protein D
VIVRGKRGDVDLVAQYLDAADRIKAQVLIEMRIVEVTLGEQFELGIQHNFNGLDVGDDSLTILQQFSTPSDDFSLHFQSANGVVDSTLQALGKYVGVELLSSPRVVAVNNTQASIDITREVPYIQSTTNVTSGTSGGVGSSSTQEVAFKSVGVKLQVTPSIRARGVIEFTVTQDLSEVAEFLNGVPAVDRRTLTSRFQVRDGETLVVGGLMQDKKSKTDRGIPLLMDLPVLGALFKSKEDRVDKRELLVFLSPRIIALDASNGVTDSWRQVLDSRRREMGLEEGVAEERRATSEAKK